MNQLKDIAEAGSDHEDADLAVRIETTLEKYFRNAELKAQERFTRLDKKLDSMQASVSRNTADIKIIRAQIITTQERANNSEKSFSIALEKIRDLEAKNADMEDRSRRDNLRLNGLKEGTELAGARAYLVENFPKWFPAVADSPPELMRAHRMGQQKPNRVRTVIMKFLRSTDRDRILAEFRKNPIEVDGRQIKFTADYSDYTTKRRKPCYTVMEQARLQGYEAFLLYPATIKLTKGHEHHFFKEVREAENFVTELGNAGGGTAGVEQG